MKSFIRRIKVCWKIFRLAWESIDANASFYDSGKKNVLSLNHNDEISVLVTEHKNQESHIIHGTVDKTGIVIRNDGKVSSCTYVEVKSGNQRTVCFFGKNENEFGDKSKILV